MVRQFHKAVDSLFEKLGRSAKYQNRDVLIFLLRPDEVVSVGFAQAHTATNIMRIRIFEAPELKVNDIILYNNKEYIVSQEPQRDTNNLVWNFGVIFLGGIMVNLSKIITAIVPGGDIADTFIEEWKNKKIKEAQEIFLMELREGVFDNIDVDETIQKYPISMYNLALYFEKYF